MGYVQHYRSQIFAQDNLLPFRIRFTFRKLIDWWEQQAASPDSFESARAKEILNRISHLPQLRECFEDPDFIEQNRSDIELLLSPFFPSLTTTNEIKAAGMPFKLILFNLTQRFTNLLDAAAGDIFLPMRDPDRMYMFGSIAILNTFYGANIQHSPNLYFDIRDQKTGILRRYRAFINADFSEIIPNGNPPPLSEHEISELKNNFDNHALWKTKIRPESFAFEGFTIITLFDVTRDESISALKFDLLRKDALLMPDSVEAIRQHLCAMLNTSNLRTGFVGYQKDRRMLQSVGYGFWNSIMLSDKKKKKIEEVCSCDGCDSILTKQPLIINNVKESSEDPLIKKLLRSKIKSYLAIPLQYNEELIGILELGSEQEQELNSITVHKLREVIPLFTTALKRSQDEKDNQVQAIIRQQCTAIHPTVGWRFTEAAENLLETQRFYHHETMEDIVFNEVYPLYGQCDIQGSSLERALAVQTDLIEQLLMAGNVLDAAISKFSFPVYNELRFRLENYIAGLREGLAAGDENAILEFLRSEIYPVFSHLQTESSEMRDAVLKYQKQLDPDLGVLYKKRKDYDTSVKQINEKISDNLDRLQVAAQEMFPHYFEKYKTDGVEHNLYIGQSMVNNRTFHQLYLQNLRLWQLLAICEIENVLQQTRPTLKADLQICSLILVHSNPLSIRFRMEEKKFDVDGAYNIRYEIIKKRIDKAQVIETNERLTQPGKIAIIYSQEKEAREYINYLNYLQSINYIGPEIEWLTLKDLQGVTGLRALRVEVVFHSDASLLPAHEILSKALESEIS